MSPIESGEIPYPQHKHKGLNRAEKYLVKARNIAAETDWATSDPDSTAEVRSQRLLRAMSYAALAHAYANQALIDQIMAENGVTNREDLDFGVQRAG